MAVLVKGMEMPKNCRACRLKMNCDDCEGFECVCLPLHTQIGYLNDLLTDKRRDDCPLIEIPEPHGRLGDLDALPWYLANTSVKYATYEDWEMLCDAIAAAPTVIPASEEGET